MYHYRFQLDYKMTNYCPILVVTVFLLAGCMNTQPALSRADYPVWILNPDKPGFISAVGAAPRQERGGREAQFRVAQMKSYQVLAQMQRAQVTSTNHTFIEERDGRVVRNDSIATKLNSEVALGAGDAKVLEEWVDPKTGELYLWVVVPK